MKMVVAVNENGARVGDSHLQARLTNGEVDLLLRLHEDGWGYRRLAEKFGISKSGVRRICKGETRCQTPARFKEVHLPANDKGKLVT